MFKLTNARGETVDINTPSLRSYTPTGLGVQFANTYSQYETYFIPTKSVLSQGIMQVYMKFGDIESQSYQSFSDFSEFLAYQPYTLEYDFDDNTYYRDARLQSLTKTEIGGSTIDAYDRLNEIFTLEFINNWYNNKTAEYKSYDPDPNLGTYGKIYGNQIADTSIQINSQGQQNKLVNTEFSPDLSGWYASANLSPQSYTQSNALLVKSNLSYNGSNAVMIDYSNQATDYAGYTKMYPDLVSVRGQSVISWRMMAYIEQVSSNSATYLNAVIDFFDENMNWMSNFSHGAFPKSTGAWNSLDSAFTNVAIPSGAVYAGFKFYPKGQFKIHMSQQMLVFDTTVGDYVQGLEYNHVATPAYTYAYEPYYVYKESTTNAGEKMMPLVNDSKYFGVQQGSPCIVTITGATTNPHWTVLQDGVTVSTDGFTLALADNQKLIVSSYPEDQYARVYNPDGSFADVSQLQDFTMTNFVQIPEGKSTVLVYVDKDTSVNLTFKEERLLV